MHGFDESFKGMTHVRCSECERVLALQDAQSWCESAQLRPDVSVLLGFGFECLSCHRMREILYESGSTAWVRSMDLDQSEVSRLIGGA